MNVRSRLFTVSEVKRGSKFTLEGTAPIGRPRAETF